MIAWADAKAKAYFVIDSFAEAGARDEEYFGVAEIEAVEELLGVTFE
ncbi:hypothetical protein M2302_002207 [Micromonospora sp. A200]|nr:hypothetical protein [Micromonospora sp. A200]MDH6462032.1 hypothetical protein [Micromonospora sp. A200]